MNLRISAWSIRNPLPVALLFALLTMLGLYAYGKLPIGQIPKIGMPVIGVTVMQNGAAPSEMETQVTRLVEDAVSGIPGVNSIHSTVMTGSSITSLRFGFDADVQKAAEDVRSAVDRVRLQLPQGIDQPIVQRVDVDIASVVTYAVAAPHLSADELSWLIDDALFRELRSQKGVALVTRIGGVTRELNVVLDPARMAALNITATQVNSALAAFSSDETGGRSQIGASEQSIRVQGSAQSVDEIRNLTIPVAGRQVRLSDIAEIGDGYGEVRDFARLNGRPVVAFQASRSADSGEIDVDHRVAKVVEAFAAKHPGVTFTRIISTADGVRRGHTATMHVLFEGIILAIMVVFWFLRDWRATAITAIAMPLSIIPTFTVMWMMGLTMNMISMLGITLVIGILVDDAIVEIENIQKRVEAGETPMQASLIGADAIGLAVVATTVSIITVFAPVTLMPGIFGQFFKSFGLTVCVAVLFSLLVARMLTPLLSAYFLKPARHDTAPAKAMHPTYARFLHRALERPWLHAGLALGLVILSLAIGSRLPVGMLAVSDNGSLFIAMSGAPGATRDTMERAVAKASHIIAADPDVETVFAQVGSIGSAYRVGDADLREGTLSVVLKQDRSVTTEQFKARIGRQLRGIPEAQFLPMGDIDQAPISISLVSQDGPALERVQAELLRQIRSLPAISDPRATPALPGPELIVRPKPAEAAALNVDSRALASVLRTTTIGEMDALVAKYSTGVRRIPIRVRFPDNMRGDLAQIGDLRVPTMDGRLTSLASVADISFQAGPGQITRINRERRVAIEANLAVGAKVGDVLADIGNLPVMKNLPPSVQIANEGPTQQMGELVGGFLFAIITGIVLTYVALVLLFGDLFKPAVILWALPPSLIGAMGAMWLTGIAVDVSSMIGLLMLMGLCAKNSILLVEFAIEAQREGKNAREALVSACAQRTRPILMTTLAMIAGMLPTALAFGEGAETRQPMAVAVIGGMISSTALSLIFVPSFYILVERLKARGLRLFTRRKASNGPEIPVLDGV